MTASLEWILLGVGLSALLTNLAGVASSIVGWTSYYPLGKKDWRFQIFWGLTHVMNGSLLGLGYLQFGGVGFPDWALPAGIVLFVGGSVIAIVATFDLGVSQTQGIDTGGYTFVEIFATPGVAKFSVSYSHQYEEGLRTDGLYHYTRNPQYVGYIPATIGYLLTVGAPFVAPICTLLLLWWLVLPFAEEPWLCDRFGDEYQQYAEQVPRFVGWTTVRRLLKNTTRKSENRPEL